MAIDPPFRLDVFRNIVNIHWTEEGQTERPSGCQQRLWSNAFIGVNYLYWCTPYGSIQGGEFDVDSGWTLQVPETQGYVIGTMTGGPIQPFQDPGFSRTPDFINFTITQPSGLSFSWQVKNEETGKIAGTYTTDFSGLVFRNNRCGAYRPSSIDWDPIANDWTLGGNMFYRGTIWFD